MRVAQPIVLNEETRRKLEQQSRGRSTAVRVVMRSKIVLLASDGLQNKQIAKTLQVAPRMVTLWRGRFLELGIEGVLKDAPRPGRTPSSTSSSTAKWQPPTSSGVQRVVLTARWSPARAPTTAGSSTAGSPRTGISSTR